MCRLIEILPVSRLEHLVLTRCMMSGELAPVLKEHSFTGIEREKTLFKLMESPSWFFQGNAEKIYRLMKDQPHP